MSSSVLRREEDAQVGARVELDHGLGPWTGHFARDVPLPGSIIGQHDISRTDDTARPVTTDQLAGSGELNDELSTRRVVVAGRPPARDCSHRDSRRDAGKLDPGPVGPGRQTELPLLEV